MSEAVAGVGARERMVVTVVSCDLVGFTAASEGVDPEDVEARLTRYFLRVRSELEAFGGTVEKFIGDAVLAVFGAPRAAAAARLMANTACERMRSSRA